MNTFFNIAVIVIVAAVVATLGDRVGRLAAKRHVAFLGLRPRLAAAWIAVFTGVLISLATLGLVSLISRDAREMLFHFDEIKSQIKQLSTEVKTLEYNRQSLAKDNRELERSLGDLSRLLVDKEREAETLATQIEESNARRAGLERELAAVESRLGESQQELEASRLRLDELHAQLEREEALAQELREEQERLREQVETLREIKDGMETEARQLEERLAALRSGNIEIEVNQPLLYVSLPAKLTLPDSQRKLISALDGLRKELEARGLKLKPVPAASVSAIMNSLSLAADDLIVVVYSANNVLPGETVEVDFELAVDHVVFRRGELITRATIEADVTRESLPQFFAYALSAVRAQALAHGMLPDIETGNIGVISASDIAGVADEIERIEGRRVLEIRAGKDFRTTDRLDSFQFVVKPARY